MKSLRAGDFTFHVPEAAREGEKRSCTLDIPQGIQGIDLEVRSPHALVNLITEDGETFYLGQGDIITWSGKVQGFHGIEIITEHTFAYQIRCKGNWLETPDPTPLVVQLDQALDAPIEQRIRTELKAYVNKLAVDRLLSDDASVEELMDDIDNGDLDFEQEPDPFGLGYEERLEEYVRAAQEASQDGSLPLEGSHPAQQPKPAQEPAKPGSENAEKPGPTSSPT